MLMHMYLDLDLVYFIILTEHSKLTQDIYTAFCTSHCTSHFTLLSGTQDFPGKMNPNPRGIVGSWLLALAD